ncbi:sulfurtransferase complex subunit TusC [Halomonas cerina]|uniref:tRNA 2-thiouridine synthesizing protein C n=1 Tax=Halomonas cerina TaxID=447424 RepID=A0A839V1M2_9GAMM|nr:sulfurtransferase complex subunit TusC [Halomonas cerina]MBB3189081.1 tRNA 2-thiouridine synthesizing protein C [Halomonas cerina]
MSETPTADLLVILRHGPHGTSWLREGLDAALVAAAFGREVSLLFMGEGVTALLPGQGPGALGQKGSSATLEMLEMYDIRTLLVEEQALADFGLQVDDMRLTVIPLSTTGVADALKDHRLILTF